MRRVFLAGAAAAVVFVIANRALTLLNGPSNLSVTAGYFLWLGLVAVATDFVSRLWRRS
jgi:hypothetical protein